MIEELVAIHNEVMFHTERQFVRYLYDKINWQNKAICLLGDRGVGKTTLLCQRLLSHYHNTENALYISADNIRVLGEGLFNIARQYFALGGEALFIDEVHKYPNWSIEIKNIIDTYKGKYIVFSGSSSLDLAKSKGDLSRRVVYYTLPGLSFREFLALSIGTDYPSYTLEDILGEHVNIVEQFKDVPILKYFKEYMHYGYYPFFREGVEDYLLKVGNMIEKVIHEDITTIYNLKNTSTTLLKKLLWLIATSNGLIPNIDKISKDLRASRETIYDCFAYLDQAGLLNNLYHDARGMKLVRKPGKIYLNNTNLLYAINGSLSLESNTGHLRETVFINQVGVKHQLHLHAGADYVVDTKWTFEVGGRNKSNRQLKGERRGYLALDDILVGYQHKIPLYLFGFLY